MKYLKKLLPILIALLFVTGVSANTADYEDTHTWALEVNNALIDTSVLPFSAYEVGGDDVSDMMVPLRAVCEQLGYVVAWDETTQTVTVDDSIQIMKLFDGCMEIAISGKFNLTSLDRIMPLAFPVVIHDGYTYVPLSMFAGIFTETAIESNVIIINPMESAS